MRLLDPGEGGDFCAIRFEEEQGDLAGVVEFGKQSSLPGGQVGYKEDDPAFIFGFERVDHSLQFTAGASTGVMHLHHYIFPFTDQGQVAVLLSGFPPDPAGDDQHQDGGHRTQPAHILAAP